MALASTTYYIVSAVDAGGVFEDMTAFTLNGGSTANYTRVVSRGTYGGNSQIFAVTVISGNVIRLGTSWGGKMLSSWTSSAADGEDVCVWTTDNNAYGKWYAEEVGTLTVNGSSYPTYYIRALGSATGRVLTRSKGGTGNIKIRPVGRPDGASAAAATTPSERQLWCFIPARFVDIAAPTPSYGRIATTRTATPTSVFAMNSGNAYLAWKGSHPKNASTNATLQGRYRFCSRAVDDGNWELGDWSTWRNFETASSYNLGWGSPVSKTSVQGSKVGAFFVSTQPFALQALSSSIDRYDYQIQIRENTTNGAGAVSTHLARQVPPVSLTSLSLSWRMDGLLVNYETSWDRSGNTVSVESSGLFAKHVFANSYGAGSVLIPTRDLWRAVGVGDSVKFRFTFKTTDNITFFNVNYVRTVQAESAVGDNITLTATVDGSLATITSDAADASAWLVIPRGHGERFIPLAGSSPWQIAPPLGVPWEVYATATVEGEYNAKRQQFPAIVEYPPAYHITSQDLATDFAVALGEGDAPDFSVSHSRDMDSKAVSGRERKVNAYGDTTDASIKFGGVLVARDGVDAYDAIAHDSHVYVRTPLGEWYQAGVSSASIDGSRSRLQTFDMTFEEEEW